MAHSTGSRNPGAAVRLLILGLLQRFGPNHGHAMRQYVHNACLDQWADVQPGSLYYALDQLAKEGLIEAERKEKVGARPARTIYAITDTGLAEFRRLLVSLLDTIRPMHDSFNLALMFSSAIEDDLLASLVTSRIARLSEEVGVLQRGCASSLSHGYISQRGKLMRGEALGCTADSADGHPLFGDMPACAGEMALSEANGDGQAEARANG
jgi:DNA-binding PadR family transcriptional regulator